VIKGAASRIAWAYTADRHDAKTAIEVEEIILAASILE
jgi:hypothetical protein